jgi:hypothetical protein
MPLTAKEQREAEELAKEFERLGPEDYESCRQGPGARRGRPSLTAPLTHSPTLHVRVPAPLLLEIESEAERQGVSVSAVVRERLARAG